jgi:hypothetical protein
MLVLPARKQNTVSDVEPRGVLHFVFLKTCIHLEQRSSCCHPCIFIVIFTWSAVRSETAQLYTYSFIYFIFSGSAAQCGLWPPVALQPSADYGLLWLCSPARTMASCGSAAQCGLWPPVALQPSAGYGLL